LEKSKTENPPSPVWSWGQVKLAPVRSGVPLSCVPPRTRSGWVGCRATWYIWLAASVAFMLDQVTPLLVLRQTPPSLPSQMVPVGPQAMAW